MNKILYTYRREDYFHLKKEKESLNIPIYPISKFHSDADVENVQYDGEMFIDISLIPSIIKSQENLLYNFERLIPLFHDEVKFIIEESRGEESLYAFRFLFDSLEKIEIFSTHLEDNGLAKNPSEVNSAIFITPRSKKIIDLTEHELEEFFASFDSNLVGHHAFKDEFKKLIKTFRIFNKIGEHKILSLFLMGDSGVGKTEVARTIQKTLNASSKIAKTNFGNYSSHDALNSLIGSPLGYIGSDGGELVKRVMESTAGLILIDEFEKATIPVFNYFLDVLETGTMVNNRAEEYDLNGYIIVFTSNISKENFKKYISPELRSRFDYKGTFNVLTNQDKKIFVENRISQILRKYNSSHDEKLDSKSFAEILNLIPYSNFKNMRDLNKKIKDVFVESIQNKNKNLTCDQGSARPTS